MKKKYLVIPGTITSESDGDLHYISASSLIRLYGVDPRECVVLSEYLSDVGIKRDELIVLRPNYRGNYDLPKKD